MKIKSLILASTFTCLSQNAFSQPACLNVNLQELEKNLVELIVQNKTNKLESLTPPQSRKCAQALGQLYEKDSQDLTGVELRIGKYAHSINQSPNQKKTLN